MAELLREADTVEGVCYVGRTYMCRTGASFNFYGPEGGP